MEGAALFTSTLMGLYQNNQNRAASARMYNQQLYDQYVRDRALAVADLEAAKTTAEGIRTAGGVRNKGIYEAAATKAGEITEAADIEARGIMSSAATTFSEAMGNVELMEAEATEALRRLANTQRVTEAESVARAGASGVRREGSTERYLQAQQQEHQTQFAEAEEGYESQIGLATETAYGERRLARQSAKDIRKAAETSASNLFTTAGLEIDTLNEADRLERTALVSAATAKINALDEAFQAQMASIIAESESQKARMRDVMGNLTIA